MRVETCAERLHARTLDRMTTTTASDRFITEPATRENLEVGAIIEWQTWNGPTSGVIVSTGTVYNFSLQVRASDGYVDAYEWIPTGATITRLNPNR